MENLVLSPINTDTLIERIAHRTVEILRLEPNTISEPEELLSREQTLNYLGVCSATLWRYERGGKIQSYGIGGKRYFKKSEIDASLIQKK